MDLQRGAGTEKVGEFTIHSSNKCALTMWIEVLEWNKRANKLQANGIYLWLNTVSYRWTSHRWVCVTTEQRFSTHRHQKCIHHMHREVIVYLELTSWCFDCIIYWIQRLCRTRLHWPCHSFVYEHFRGIHKVISLSTLYIIRFGIFSSSTSTTSYDYVFCSRTAAAALRPYNHF